MVLGICGMLIFSGWNDLKEKLRLSDSLINTLANHLIVIFIVSMPLLISVRRLSLFFVLVLFVLRGRIIFYISEAIKDPVIKALVFYFLIHVIWLIGTNEHHNGKSTVHDAAFLVIPLLFSSFIDKKYIPRMYAAFFVGMFASVLVSFGIFLEIIPPMVHYGDQGIPSDPTPIYHRTHYGFMLAISSVLVLQRLITGKDNQFFKFIMLVFFIAVSINIFITGGRSGYILYVIFIVMLITLLFEKISFKSLIAVVVIAGSSFFLAYHASPVFKDRVTQTVVSVNSILVDSDYANSVGGRIGIVEVSLDLIRDNWMFGLGTGDQTKEIMNEIRKKDSGLANFFHALAHPHNEYLSAILQFGIIGLLVFLSIPVTLLWYKNSDKDMERMFKLLAIGIVFFTFADVFVLGLGMLFTVLVLISIGLRRYITDNAVLNGFSFFQAIYYVISIVLFYLIQTVIP